MPREIYVPGQGFVPIEAMGQEQGISETPLPPATAQEMMAQRGLADSGGPPTADDMWELGGDLLPLIAGVGAGTLTGGSMGFPAKLAVEGVVNAGAGAVGNWMKGEDPTTGAALNAGLGTAGSVVGKAAPGAFNRLAQLFGGKYKNLGQDADAFTRYRSRAHKGGQFGISVGAKDRTDDAVKEWGQRVKHAELANPTRSSIQATLGDSQDDLITKASDSIFPIKEKAGIRGRLGEHISQLQQDRGSFVPDPDNILDIEGFVQDPTGISTHVKRRTPGRVRNVKDAEIIDDDVIDVTAQGSDFKTRDSITQRELGNLKRAAAGRSDDVIKQRAAGAAIPASEKAAQQFDANLGSAWKKEQTRADTGPVAEELGISGDIADSNSVLSDLKRMQGTNAAIRNPWSPGAITARAGAGTGLGLLIDQLVGLPNFTTSMGLTPAFVAGSPTNLSRFGHALGMAADSAPTGIRSSNALGTATDIIRRNAEGDEKKKTRRREPK